MVADKQYSELWLYEAMASLDEGADEDGLKELKETLEEDDRIDESLSAHTTSMTARRTASQRGERSGAGGYGDLWGYVHPPEQRERENYTLDDSGPSSPRSWHGCLVSPRGRDRP